MKKSRLERLEKAPSEDDESELAVVAVVGWQSRTERKKK